jgi:SAM-dependent methyltransferase
VLAARCKAVGGSRNGYVASALPSKAGKVLDVGCSYGWALDSARGKADELWGIDTDADAIHQAESNYPDINFVHGSATSLPFADETFDAVVLSEVIEHVPGEESGRVVDEIHRVLKAGGVLVFTAPYAGLLAWTDPLDFKRRFPSIYRRYMRATRYTPATPPEVGHTHLSKSEISSLLGDRFDVEEVRFCGLLTPFLTWFLVVGTRLHVLPRRLEYSLNRFRAWESGVPYGPLLSFNVRLLARK